MATPLVVGLDAGGTKTECVVADGTRERVVLGPGANVARLGAESAADVLVAVLNEALDGQDRSALAAVCAGVAGAGRESDQAVVKARLEAEVGDVPVVMVHDGVIALEAALGGGSGIMTIIGTGSVVLGKTKDGQLTRAGGWGYRLGDDGSGYQISFRGLRAVAAAYDGGPSTTLVDVVQDVFGISCVDELIHRVYNMAWPFQELAPHVIAQADAGDAVSRHILSSEAMKLARQLVWVAKREGVDYDQRLSFIGGLSNEQAYKSVLDQAVSELLPKWEIVAPAGRPVTGALRLAWAAARTSAPARP